MSSVSRTPDRFHEQMDDLDVGKHATGHPLSANL
jgi:hypothetical protein